MTRQCIIFLSGDLVFAARVRAFCQNVDLDFIFGASLPAADPALAPADFNPRYLILDLSTRSGLLNSLVIDGRQRFPNAKLIAYAPHVHKERLAKANAAGYDQVLTRGQFDVWLSALKG